MIENEVIDNSIICHCETNSNKSCPDDTNCYLIFTKKTLKSIDLSGVITVNLFASQHFTEAFVLSLHMFFIV